tara:strand:+ start:966 stop:1577 length:612 start_codon:yes stop_codon:yes gene_type:complete
MTAILKVDTIQDTAGNNIINESSDTITIGASGDTTNIVGTLQNNGSALISGITNAQQWRVTSDFTGDADPITSNWEQADSDSPGIIGDAMSQSSGVFTFPSTGIYYIAFQVSARNPSSSSLYQSNVIGATTDNSSFSSAAEDHLSIYAANSYGNSNTAFLFDVTNTSTHKVRFSVSDQSNNTITLGDSNNHRTGVTFIRLGNT